MYDDDDILSVIRKPAVGYWLYADGTKVELEKKPTWLDRLMCWFKYRMVWRNAPKA